MQPHQSFDGAGVTRREPHVPLTESQRFDYENLMYRAELLRAEGKRDEARRFKLLAVKIVQSGAPALDRR